MQKLYFLKKNFFLFLLFCISVLLSSCIKEKIDVSKTGNNSISPQYAAALGYSSLTLADIMKKTNKNGQIVTDSTGFLTLVYKGNLFSLKAADVVSIPVQPATNLTHALSAVDVAAINSAPLGGTISFKDSSLINFMAGGSTQIDVLNCKTAVLTINMNYAIEHPASIKITIPSATLGGVPFTQTIPVQVGTPYTGPIQVTQTYSLNGYSIDMTNGGTAHNVIKIKYDILLIKTSNSTNIGDAVSFSQTFSNVAYNSIIGYLGQQALSPNTDTIPITIFQNNILNSNATFHIVNPLIKVFLTNSYGLPIKAGFNIFDGYTPGQALVPITGAPNPLPIQVPATIGQSVRDSFQLTTANSNIYNLINNFPKNVIYNVNSLSNPLGPVYTNFITDTSQFNVDMELDLPLNGTVSNFMFQDTIAYSFTSGSGANTNAIESITVRAFFDNGFPIDVGMRVAFVDSAYNVIDELVNPLYTLVIPSASIGANGMVSASTQSTSDFVIPSSVIPQIGKVKHVLIGAVVNTTNHANTNVKIYNFYHLDVKLGVNVQTFLKF